MALYNAFIYTYRCEIQEQESTLCAIDSPLLFTTKLLPPNKTMVDKPQFPSLDMNFSSNSILFAYETIANGKVNAQ